MDWNMDMEQFQNMFRNLFCVVVRNGFCFWTQVIKINNEFAAIFVSFMHSIAMVLFNKHTIF